MTKSEQRRARKAARAAGQTFNVERRADGGLEFVAERTDRQKRGHAARMARWARRYDALNGAPEDWSDR